MRILQATSTAQPVTQGLWQKAVIVAARAHEGAVCPGTKVPYFAHPARVAMIVATRFQCQEEDILAAAYLHDVVEKSPVSLDEIRAEFGEIIAHWVDVLSKDPEGKKGSYWESLRQAPWQARLVKIADALDHLNGPECFLRDRLKSARKAAGLRCPHLVIQRAVDLLDVEIDRLESNLPA